MMIPLLPSLLFLLAALLYPLQLQHCHLAPLSRTLSCLGLLRNPFLLLGLAALLLPTLSHWRPRRAWLRSAGLGLLLIVQLAVIAVLMRGLIQVRGSIQSTVERIGNEQQDKLAEQRFSNVSKYQRNFLENLDNVLGMGLNTSVHSDIPLKDLIVRYLVDSLQFYPNLQVFGDLQAASNSRFKDSLKILKSKKHLPAKLLQQKFRSTNSFLEGLLLAGLAAIAFRLLSSLVCQSRTSMITGFILVFACSLTVQFLQLVAVGATAGSLNYLSHLNIHTHNFNCKPQLSNQKISLQLLQITRAERLFARIQALRSDRPFPMELLKPECSNSKVEFSSWDCQNKQCRGVEQLVSGCRPMQFEVIKQKVGIVREIISKIKLAWLDTQLLFSEMNSGSILSCQKQLGNLFSKSYARIRTALQKTQSTLLVWSALLLILAALTFTA